MSNKDDVKLMQFTGDNKAEINSILPAGTQAYSLNDEQLFEYRLVIDGTGTPGYQILKLSDWVMVKDGKVGVIPYRLANLLNDDIFSKVGIDLGKDTND